MNVALLEAAGTETVGGTVRACVLLDNATLTPAEPAA
jgi:hypothetical protein